MQDFEVVTLSSLVATPSHLIQLTDPPSLQTTCYSYQGQMLLLLHLAHDSVISCYFASQLSHWFAANGSLTASTVSSPNMYRSQEVARLVTTPLQLIPK